MKTLRLTILLLITLAAGQVSFAGGIEFFHGTWKEALEKAKEEDKIVFVDAYAKWCGPCKRMAKNVFTQDKVGEFFNTNFVNLKLDMEETDGLTFGKEYPVSAYPTLFFLGGDGSVIKKVRGGQKAESLIQHAENALSGYDRSGDYEEKYLAGDRDYDLVYNYVKALVQAKKPHLIVANDYLRSEPAITPEQRNQLVYVAATESDSKIFEEFVINKDAMIDMVGAEEFDNKVKSACMTAVDKAIEYDYPDLLTEAIAIAKNNLTEGGNIFQFEAKMNYALQLTDASTYVTNARTYVKKKKYNESELHMVITKLNEKFDDDKEAMGLGADLVDKSTKYRSIPLDRLPVYAKVMTLGGDKKEAIKTVEKAIEENSGNTQVTDRMKGVLNYIKNLEELK